jgi:hypothetical protein
MKSFERKSKPVISNKAYLKRQLYYFFLSIFLIAFSLLIGVIGYHYTGPMGWLDAFYNSSMILTGMGPVNVITNDSGKWFASFYALYSGVAFLTTAGVMLSPLVHRILHILHAEDKA